MKGPIVIAGGGTGGHVFVADAVSSALVDEGIDLHDLRFLGSSRGQEKDLLKDTGIELTLLPGRGIKRSLRPRAIVDNLGALVGISLAFFRSLTLMAKWRPTAVVSVGGYAAAPAGVAAIVLRRPLILINVDAIPGVTHRVLGRFAAASCVSFESNPLPRAVVTGSPVRDAFAEVDRSEVGRREAKIALGCDPEKPLVAVTTGSLGARSVNTAVVGLAELWSQRSATIYHVTGRRDADEILALRPPVDGGPLDYRIVPFETNVPLLFQAADVAITRAGALTVAELALVGLAAVLVPLPGAPGDHQTLNARALADSGGGIVVADRDVSSGELDALVTPLLDDDGIRSAMESAARALGHGDAAHAAARVVLNHAR